jgi:signal transduction histidine kinase
MVEVRTISHLLHPPLLDEVGLESATRWYADGFAKRCALKVSLHLDPITNRLPKEVELALFRVLQESLTNVHRHASAKSIEIVLTCADGQVVLCVIDDGKGISPEVVTRFRPWVSRGCGNVWRSWTAHRKLSAAPVAPWFEPQSRLPSV